MLDLSRRAALFGIIAAPAIVKIDSLMKLPRPQKIIAVEPPSVFEPYRRFDVTLKASRITKEPIPFWLLGNDDFVLTHVTSEPVSVYPLGGPVDLRETATLQMIHYLDKADRVIPRTGDQISIAGHDYLVHEVNTHFHRHEYISEVVGIAEANG
jgi:hypothetical protein